MRQQGYICSMRLLSMSTACIRVRHSPPICDTAGTVQVSSLGLETTHRMCPRCTLSMLHLPRQHLQ